MENREAIKIINQYDMNFHWNDGEPIPAEQLAEAFDLAISALENQSRIITVTDAEGGLLASISDKDIIEENGVHVIISEE